MSSEGVSAHLWSYLGLECSVFTLHCIKSNTVPSVSTSGQVRGIWAILFKSSAESRERVLPHQFCVEKQQCQKKVFSQRFLKMVRRTSHLTPSLSIDWAFYFSLFCNSQHIYTAGIQQKYSVHFWSYRTMLTFQKEILQYLTSLQIYKCLYAQPLSHKLVISGYTGCYLKTKIKSPIYPGDS